MDFAVVLYFDSGTEGKIQTLIKKIADGIGLLQSVPGDQDLGIIACDLIGTIRRIKWSKYLILFRMTFEVSILLPRRQTTQMSAHSFV